jgi:hypothetical protein
MAAYWHQAEVTFRPGAFPLDMLRYDCCYPLGQESVQDMLPRRRAIDPAYTGPPVPPPLVTITVQTVGFHKASPWTVERWATFGAILVPQPNRTARVV